VLCDWSTPLRHLLLTDRRTVSLRFINPYNVSRCTVRVQPTALAGLHPVAISINIERARLTPIEFGGTMAIASTSLGEASARIQATDLERRKTPRVRTAPPGLRVEPKWLPEFSDTPCSAKALTRGVQRPARCAGFASSRVHRVGTPVCPGREEVRRNES
jgi:hypothetical protein